MIKRGLTLDNALNITPHILINDAAGPEAGCTTAQARTPVPDAGTGCRRAHEAPDHGPPSAAVVMAVTNGRLDFGTWERILCQLDG